MSIELISKAFQSGTDPTARFVLVALADYVNAKRVEKGCWPSVRALRAKTGFGERTIQAAVKRLEDQGHISVVQRPGRPSVYLVHPDIPRTNCGGVDNSEAFGTEKSTPAVPAHLPRKGRATSPAAAAPKPETTKKETRIPNQRSGARARPIGELLRGSSNPSIRQISS